MQELNKYSVSHSNITAVDHTGGDKVVYFGVINVNEGGKTANMILPLSEELQPWVAKLGQICQEG